MASHDETRPCGAHARSLPGKVGVLVVDDQAIFRNVARELIRATPGFELIDEAESGMRALALADETEPALALVDVNMPGMDGIATAARLRAAHPSTVVILVSAEEPLDLPCGVGTCGAAAFVRKQDLRPATLRRIWGLHGGSSVGSA